jgi:UDP-N-acetylmuramate: L-alanyl-gamma-D-glutamyl-meso-diaminopimelate ligase
MRGEGRLWVVLEPRSNTMRTRIHQERLPQCFDAADEVIFVPASDRNLAADEVLDTQAICSALGDKAQVLPDAAAIISHIATHATQGDDILILSNGGFDGIHQRLLSTLEGVPED